MIASPAPSNVTDITPRSDNLHEAINALHGAAITGDYRYSALALAGPLMSEVGKVFPQNFILIYLVSSYKIRQSWNSWLAKMFCDPLNPQPIIDPSAVREKLMRTSSKKLLMEAYGSIPDGLIRALSLLGLEGQQPQVYLQLHEQMSKSATLRKAYSHASKIEASTVTTIAALPEPLQSYELAKQFRDPKDIKTLLFMIDTLAQGDDAKYEELCAKVVNAAKRGHSVSAVLKREYYETPFPDPAIPNSENCKHISSCDDLRKAAHQFYNCLRDYCEEGIRGEYQYYRWFENKRPVAVISLREDAPYGFRIYEIKGKRNEYIDDGLELKIVKHFEQYKIYKMASLEGLLRELGYLGVLNDARQHNPVDHINDVIDGLLDDGAP